MSARVDVLQNLLAPCEHGEKDPTDPKVDIVAPASARGSKGDEATVANASTKLAHEEKGGVGGSGSGSGALHCDKIIDTAERLLGGNSEDGSRNTNKAVGGFAGTMARHEAAHPGLRNESNSHEQQAEAMDHLSTPGTETRGHDPRTTRTRAGSGLDASALDRRPGRRGGSLGATDESDAMERVEFDDTKTLLRRPSSFPARSEGRWDEQKAGPRPAIGERFDELEELEVRRASLYVAMSHLGYAH